MVFGKGYPPMGRRVQVWLGSQSLRIEDSAGNHEVPYASLEIACGGWQGESILLEWDDVGGTSSLTLDEARAQELFLSNAPQALVRRLGSWKAQVRQSKRRLRMAILGGLGLALLPLIALGILIVQADGIVSAAVGKISLEWEAELGQHLQRSYLRQHRVLTEGAVTRAIHQISDPLIDHAGSAYAFNIVVVEDSSANAFALPGGSIVVCSGLLAETQRPEELAGVVAHLIQHVQQRHGLRALVRGMGLKFALQLFFRGDALRGAMRNELQQLEGHRFSRQQESEADLNAVELLQSAGIDPLGMATFFERFSGLKGEPPVVLTTHPSNNQRMRNIRAAAGSQVYAPMKLDWDEVLFEVLRMHAFPPAQVTHP